MSGVLVKTGHAGCIGSDCRRCAVVFDDIRHGEEVVPLPRTSEFVEGRYFKHVGDGCCDPWHINTLSGWKNVEHFDSKQDARWRRSWHYDPSSTGTRRRLEESMWADVPASECERQCLAEPECGGFVVTSDDGGAGGPCSVNENTVLGVSGVQFGASRCTGPTLSGCVLKGMLPVTSTRCNSVGIPPLNRDVYFIPGGERLHFSGGDLADEADLAGKLSCRRDDFVISTTGEFFLPCGPLATHPHFTKAV